MSPLARKIGLILLWCGFFGQSIGFAVMEKYLRRNSVVVPGVVDDEAILESFIRISLEHRIIADGAGKIVYVSPNLAKLLGYKPEELKGQYADVLIPTRYQRNHKLSSDKALTRHDGKISSVKCHALAKDGTELPFEIRVRVTMINANPFMFVSMVPLDQLKD